jgi:hypothetical protein
MKSRDGYSLTALWLASSCGRCPADEPGQRPRAAITTVASANVAVAVQEA